MGKDTHLNNRQISPADIWVEANDIVCQEYITCDLDKCDGYLEDP